MTDKEDAMTIDLKNPELIKLSKDTTDKMKKEVREKLDIVESFVFHYIDPDESGHGITKSSVHGHQAPAIVELSLTLVNQLVKVIMESKNQMLMLHLTMAIDKVSRKAREMRENADTGKQT